jgi:hypothetical protein
MSGANAGLARVAIATTWMSLAISRNVLTDGQPVSAFISTLSSSSLLAKSVSMSKVRVTLIARVIASHSNIDRRHPHQRHICWLVLGGFARCHALVNLSVKLCILAVPTTGHREKVFRRATRHGSMPMVSVFERLCLVDNSWGTLSRTPVLATAISESSNPSWAIIVGIQTELSYTGSAFRSCFIGARVPPL